MDDLSLFTSWKLCSYCRQPSIGGGEKTKNAEKRLKSCSRCHSASFHDVTCQRAHWISGHKTDCKKLHDALKPLLDLIKWQHCKNGIVYEYTSWLPGDMMIEFLADRHNTLWQEGLRQWNDQNYLVAMRFFQNYLSPYKELWCLYPNKDPFHVKHLSDPAHEKLFCEGALQLAKRLLFCGYCEMDGNEVDSARQRLVQCLSLLITIQPLESSCKEEVRIHMDDAWMELTLSMEEIPSVRVVARHGRSTLNIFANNEVNNLQSFFLTKLLKWPLPQSRVGGLIRCKGQVSCHKYSLMQLHS